jgi:hypothetical protein
MKSAAASASEATAATKARDKININIFLSQDVQDDVGCSDNETTTPAVSEPRSCTKVFNYQV